MISNMATAPGGDDRKMLTVKGVLQTEQTDASQLTDIAVNSNSKGPVRVRVDTSKTEGWLVEELRSTLLLKPSEILV